MAITIKEINVRTTIVRGEQKRESSITPEMIRNLKEEIIRELKQALPDRQIRKER